MKSNKEILDMYHNISKRSIDIIYDIDLEIKSSGKASEYTIGQIPKLFELINKEMSQIDFTEFDQEELKLLGFRLWDDNGLMLAPSWVFSVMKSGTELTSISGDIKIFGLDYIDMDTRFGSTAWGLTKAQLRDHKIESVLDAEKTN